MAVTGDYFGGTSAGRGFVGASGGAYAGRGFVGARGGCGASAGRRFVGARGGCDGGCVELQETGVDSGNGCFLGGGVLGGGFLGE